MKHFNFEAKTEPDYSDILINSEKALAKVEELARSLSKGDLFVCLHLYRDVELFVNKMDFTNALRIVKGYEDKHNYPELIYQISLKMLDSINEYTGPIPVTINPSAYSYEYLCHRIRFDHAKALVLKRVSELQYAINNKLDPVIADQQCDDAIVDLLLLADSTDGVGRNSIEIFHSLVKHKLVLINNKGVTDNG